MSVSTTGSDKSGEEITSPKRVAYKYDVRLEVGSQPNAGTIHIVSIFRELVKKMKDAVDSDKPLAVLTATDQMFFEDKEMSKEEFQKAFKVDQLDGKVSKVVLGFKLNTMTTLSDIKQRLLKAYLIPHDLFLREHVGGFQEGLKTFTYGFLKHDHPDHPDISKLKQRFARITSEAWKKMDKVDRNKWKDEVPQIFYADGVAIPVNFSKERIVSEVEGKPKITTNAIVVSTPKQFGPLLRSLLDIAVLGKKITNLVPFAFQREEPTGYYYILAAHARFMEQHRNIPILNVPHEAATQRGKQGETLENVLNGNKDILRVAYDSKQNRYHVSTHAPKYREVHTWITNVLATHNFPYSPSIRPMKYGGPQGSMKYSAVFADAVSVANESYDASTIKTARSNAWKPRPPLDISYVPTEEAFPPLPKKASTTTPTTQSTTSETLDEDTIQSAISSAIKTIQEQHRVELAQLQQEMQTKMDAMQNQMLELGKQIAYRPIKLLSRKTAHLLPKQITLSFKPMWTSFRTS